jgi:hypothetical protein
MLDPVALLIRVAPNTPYKEGKLKSKHAKTPISPLCGYHISIMYFR